MKRGVWLAVAIFCSSCATPKHDIERPVSAPTENWVEELYWESHGAKGWSRCDDNKRRYEAEFNQRFKARVDALSSALRYKFRNSRTKLFAVPAICMQRKKSRKTLDREHAKAMKEFEIWLAHAERSLATD